MISSKLNQKHDFCSRSNGRDIGFCEFQSYNENQRNEDSSPSSVSSTSSGFEYAVESAIVDTLRLLYQIKKRGQVHNKVLFVYRWGRSENAAKILRPFSVKLYDNLTGRVHDIRSSAEMANVSSKPSDYLSLTSLERGSFISPLVQTTILNRIRLSGYSCSFVDVSVDRNGSLVWKNQGRRSPQNVSSGSIQCLMVNT